MGCSSVVWGSSFSLVKFTLCISAMGIWIGDIRAKHSSMNRGVAFGAHPKLSCKRPDLAPTSGQYFCLQIPEIAEADSGSMRIQPPPLCYRFIKVDRTGCRRMAPSLLHILVSGTLWMASMATSRSTCGNGKPGTRLQPLILLQRFALISCIQHGFPRLMCITISSPNFTPKPSKRPAGTRQAGRRQNGASTVHLN